MKIHIGNLSKEVTNEQLNDLAVPFGAVQSASVAVDRLSGASKGFGFVEYENADSAKAAIAGLDGKEVQGQALKVSEARPKKF